jgi:large repetitive protein
VPVTIVDNDGDTASGGSLAITLNPTTPPVVLDLDGDGVEFLALADGVTYDYGSGLVQTAWVAADDGLLARDTGSGWDIVFSDDVSGAETDLEGLKLAYDSNGDGKLTAADADFGEFGVWQDVNSNGLVDTGEFQSLFKMGITSIDLNAEGSGTGEGGGDVVVHGTGQYTMKGTTYTLADVSFRTAGADDRIAARTTEIAAVSLAAAGFMAAEAVHAEVLPPAAIEAVVAALQTFEAPAPEIQVSLPETSQTSFATPLDNKAPQHQEADALSDSLTDSESQEAQHGLTEVESRDLAPEPFSESDGNHIQSSAPAFSFGGGDSALMQALLLAAQTAGSDEQKPANLAEVREAFADSEGQQGVDSLIDHFAAQDGSHDAGAEDTALDHALGTMLAGAGVDGLHMAGMAEGFELAAMVAAAEAHSVAVA